ncbi:MAG: LPS-assembly protein LptD [Pararhodobacter sp.]|nr:LPS-assembly protein LptD [Pararhodobacter sp.]
MRRGKWTIRASADTARAACLAVAMALFAPTPSTAQDVASLMADSVFLDRAGRLIASGSVEVWHGSVRLSARQVIFDRRSGQLSITGPITLSDGPDRVLLADEAELSRDLRDGLIRSARLVLDQQLQVAAAEVERQGGRNTQMTAVVASSCRVCAENPTPLWEIRADRVIHDEEAQQLHFHRAQFRLGGVPLVYLPRLRIPAPGNDRSAGMLVPQLQLSTDFGLGVGLPYFMPLGASRDLTLTPIMASRGMAGLAFRYRQAFSSGGIAFSGQVSRDRLIPGRLRGYGHVQGHFALARDFRLDFDLLVPSDRSYLESYDITGDSRLQSHVTLERIRRDQAVRARALAFHSLRVEDANRQLPNLALQAEWEERIGLQALPVGGELRLRFAGHAHRRHSSIDGDAGRDLARLNATARWHDRSVLPGGMVLGGALQGRVDHVRIGDDSRFPDPVTRYSLEGMADLRLPLAAVDSAGGRHLLEPVAQLVLSRRNAAALPNDDHRMPELDGGNLFAMTRYSGHDAADDGSRLNAGLRWVRHAPGGWSVEALGGRIWRRGALDGFEPGHAQPLGELRSDWLLAGRLDSAQGLALDMRLLIDDDRRLSRGETNLYWQRGGTQLSTGYLYLPASAAEERAADLSEWSVDLGQELGGGWVGRLGWEYDIAQQGVSAARTGLEFRNECLSVDVSLSRRFATSTNIAPSTRFGLRVELLGIGGRAGAGGAARNCST